MNMHRLVVEGKAWIIPFFVRLIGLIILLFVAFSLWQSILPDAKWIEVVRDIFLIFILIISGIQFILLHYISKVLKEENNE